MYVKNAKIAATGGKLPRVETPAQAAPTRESEVITMSNFLICLLGFGIFAVPCLIIAISFNDEWKERLFACGVICVIWLTFSVGCAFGHDVNAEKWNDGHCKCGTHWELRGASQYRTSHTKYYVCPDCHAEIEINN